MLYYNKTIPISTENGREKMAGKGEGVRRMQQRSE